MSETIQSEANADSEKPVQMPGEHGEFPPFPDPTDDDFEEDVPQEDRTYFKTKFQDLNNVTKMRVHCTSCDRHLGLVPKNENRMRMHPMLHTLVCQTCHTFYNSGEFEKGDDGSELYCRWCGQGGQVYCCSACPHVFCAKCIKRNLGPTKIKEIEALDDWKCFNCNSSCLKDLRAICWAALRFCDLKNRLTNTIQDATLKLTCIQDCTQDHSECCKSKFRKKERVDTRKKETEIKKNVTSIISKIPPTIQVKKFASINVDEVNKTGETKKAVKRPASPKNKPFILKNPISVASKVANTFNVSPMTKRMRIPDRFPTPTVINPIRIINDRKQVQPMNNFIKIKPKPTFNVMFNGMSSSTFSNVINNDNINLSLESLTQGLDMATMSGMASGTQDDELVCTPDFPIEPLCEVTEDNTDDDVQCITPGPSVTPKCPPPLVPCSTNLTDISSDSIVQMTEQDVSVNTATGGLKFRVDPQTLSSNKMYRLPDGRIFAINANPNMPGGYSATIVAIAESTSLKNTGPTFSAKINHVTSRQSVSTPTPRIITRNVSTPKKVIRPQKTSKEKLSRNTPPREPDLQVPVEWYRYNIIDAIDALEYSLSKLHKLKRDATTSYLRTRTVPEMRTLHRSLENLLNLSTQRFKEIRENINKELKQYILRKTPNTQNSDDEDEDDDDVLILPNTEDDPIFIDENSLDSSTNDTQEVDLTGPGSSEHNDSEERHLRAISYHSMDKDDRDINVPVKSYEDKTINSNAPNFDSQKENNLHCEEQMDTSQTTSSNCNEHIPKEQSTSVEENKQNGATTSLVKSKLMDGDYESKSVKPDINVKVDRITEEKDSKKSHNEELIGNSNEDNDINKENGEHNDSKSKTQDIDISDEMIDSLLTGDSKENSDSNELCTLESSDEVKN